MKAYHHIIGDSPSQGFNLSIDSPGFPKETWATGLKSIRASVTAPFSNAPVDSKVVELHRTYELQSLRFGLISVINSAVGFMKMHGSRPHGFTHVVALAPEREGEIATDSSSYSQWLSYDAFLSMRDFWGITAQTSAMEARPFTPPPAIRWAWPDALPSGMQEALLFRYWRTATLRAFGVKQNATEAEKVINPLEVCLGAETAYTQIIQSAKAFFGAVIASQLPLPVHNILSISAPVSGLAPLTPFHPTAMVFLYPEANIPVSERLFDLRTGAFVPLSEKELRFAQMVMQGKQPAFLAELYQRYARLTGCPSQAHCTFMADFDIAWLLYRLETEKLTPQELFTVWRELSGHLSLRHGLSASLRDDALVSIENHIVALLGEGTASDFSLKLSTEDVRFVLKKALFAPQALANQECVILERHQRARQQPFIATVLNEIQFSDPAQLQRGSDLYRTILENAYVTPLLAQPERDLLSSAGYLKLCEQYPPLKAATAQFVSKVLETHPESSLFMTPLSTHFGDGFTALRRSLLALTQSGSVTLPDEGTCRDIGRALKFLNDENRALLVRYHVDCFMQHLKELKLVEPVFKAIGFDLTEPLCGIFEACTANQPTLDEPLNAEQIQQITIALLPQVPGKDRVQKSLLDYIAAVLQRSFDSQQDRFLWLCQIDAQGILLSRETRQNIATKYYCEYYSEFLLTPPSAAYQNLFQWLSANNAPFIAKHADAILRLYDNLGEEGLQQLRPLLPFFTDTSAAPYVNSVLLKKCQKDLMAAWTEKADFWEGLEAQRPQWNKGRFTAAQLFVSEVNEAAAQVLAKQATALRSPRGYSSACQQRDRQPDDAFRAFWDRTISDAFVRQFDVLVAEQCKSFEDITLLKQLITQMRASNQLQGSAACRGIDAVTDVKQFIESELQQLSDPQLIEQAQKKIALLLAVGDMRMPWYKKLRNILKEYFFVANRAELKRLSLRKKAAVGLLCTATAPGQFMGKEFLMLFDAWDEKTLQKPFAEENLPLFATVSALFGLLQQYHLKYPEVLCDALQGETFDEYTRAVRKNRKQLALYCPWLTSGWKKHPTSFEPTKALVRWLS